MVIEQPLDGETIQGQWVSVSGWVEPNAVKAVLVVGAPIEGLYLPTGHVGVPTVEVTLAADGRFIAPRVPLQEGATELTLLPLGASGAVFTPVKLNVFGAQTSLIPATLVAAPPQTEPGKPVVLRASTGTKDRVNWQWDFEGDGVFEEEGTSAKHAYPVAGNFAPLARTRVNGRWVYARGKVQVGNEPAVLLATTEVDDPHQLVAILTDRRAATQTLKYVLAIDKTAVRVFGPDLKSIAVISGLDRPGGAWVDPQGRFLVLEAGRQRIGRYLANGTLDPAFATAGYFTGTADRPLANATSLGCHQVLMGGKQVGYRPKDDAWAEVEAFEEDWKLSDALKAEAKVVVTAEVCPLYSGPMYLVNGQVARRNIVNAIENLASPKSAIAVSGGLASYADDYVVVDAAGAVIFYRDGSESSTWKLGYPVHAVAINPEGQTYVAGPGHLELRDFPRVR